MFRLSAVASLSVLCLPALAWVNYTNVVDLGYAKYQGSYNSTADITFFLGLRYAEAPVGELRFQAPQAPGTTEDIILADLPPPPCPQGARGVQSTQPYDVQPISKRQSGLTEDCLFLNVFVPGSIKAKAKAKLPVVVWIHGGGYLTGSQQTFNGASLVQDANGGAISVIIQYRLGVFGFLAGTEMKKNGALNIGLLDQNAALQWVHKHIAAFGGDPDKVTIWGESAGAGSVLQHVVAHDGNTQPPLFRAAMTSSTFLPSQWHYDDPIPELLYNATVVAAGCSDAASTFKCLQGLDVNALESVNQAVGLTYFYGTYNYVPVVDDTFIVDRPIVTLSKGHHNAKTLFSVTNAFEGSIFVNASAGASGELTDYVANLFPTLNSTQVTQVANAYLNIGLDNTTNQAIGIMGESIFICPTYRLLDVFPGHSWKGKFAIPPGQHSQDINYYFPQYVGRGLFYDNQVFRTSFAQSFLAVVMSLDPNDTPDPTNITPQWVHYNQNKTEMLFNETTSGDPDIRPFTTDPALLERCQMWLSLAPDIGQ